MMLHNRTPLVIMAFPTEDLDGDPCLVVVAKGTFDVVKGEPIRWSASPSPIRTTAVPWDPSVPSSVRYEDDLAPFKVGTDIIVNATAYAPGGQRMPSWRAGVCVGGLKKFLTVTGPRAWVHAPLLGWSLTPIVPVRHVPVRYELAFGGDGVEANPVGLGACEPRKADTSQPIPAPRVLAGDGRVPELGELYPVEGLGAIARTWQPRCARAGTFGEAWASQGGRRLPEDFDGAFWNAAHPELVMVGFLRGDEEVRLTALHPEHAELGFRLPAVLVATGAVYGSGYRHGTPARLDTVLIDAEALRVELTWRAALPLFKGGVEAVHIAMRPLAPAGGAS